jgi:acyl-phosphate glycerol 3-phosphate acyltransferase
VTQISPLAGAALAVLASYLIGSIPFGYLIARAVKGLDIRTVGSGNLGATNVGRVLGRRFFWIVLALDLLKGFLPTIGLPALVERLTGVSSVDLPVLVGLSAILGHTFPVYLKFRGGKGVATSLGVVLALEPISCAVAVLVFGAVLAISRYMSLASLAGGVGFMVAHFVLNRAPFSREHIAMSLFSIAVVGLLFVRHRSNLARIWAGTENRLNPRRPAKNAGDKTNDDGPSSTPREGPPPPRSGRIGLFLAIGLAILSLVVVTGIWLVHNAARSIEAVAGPWALKETDRLTTGQQRVDRVAFAAGGDCLAGICPRYNRLVIYRVDAAKKLRPVAETQLEGRPVGVVSLGSRFAVLQRPAGDAKHLEPGWWEVFDREGKRVGSRILAGFYPDDIAASPDGHLVFVLCSGRSEGDEKKPLASLDVLALEPKTASSRLLGRVTFDASDDPERVTLSASSRYAAVLLAKSKRSAAVDVSDPTAPQLIGRTPAALNRAPYVSQSEDADWIMMPMGSEGNTIVLESPHTPTTSAGQAGPTGGTHPDYLVTTRENESALEILQVKPQHEVGRFPLLGPFNLGRTRPTGLAYSPERGIIAVATRTGSIHVVEMRVR